MKSFNGFTLVEVLIAMSILMMLIATIVPVYTLISKERKVLYDRRTISSMLHENIQSIIYNQESMESFTVEIHHNQIQMNFKKRDTNIVEGCAAWINAKEKEEEICLYGYKEQ